MYNERCGYRERYIQQIRRRDLKAMESTCILIIDL